MGVTARLADDSGTTLLSMGRDMTGLVLNSIDLGYPDVRAATSALSGQHGVLDTTRYMGARAIVAEVTLPVTGVGTIMDTTRGLMNPGKRYWLHVLRDEWTAERRIQVRGATLAMKSGALPLTAQLGWSAPTPLFQEVAATSVTLNPTAQASSGRTYPKTYPWSYQPGLAPGASVLQVGGNASALPTVAIYGPCTAPVIRVVDTGAQLSFPNLSIAQGDYLFIDAGARTVTLNNDPSQSRYSSLDFSTATWPTLPSGSPQVIFSPATSSPGSVAVVTWRNLWL